MSLRQAAQQALEALEHEARTGNDDAYRAERDALRAALAEPEQEPVACIGTNGELMWLNKPKVIYSKPIPLYTAPTPRKPQTTHWEGCEAVHPECKAKAEQEWVATWENKYGMKEWEVHAIRAGWMPAPIPRRPLTDEEMRECAQSMNAEPLAEGWPELIKFARAIEKSHGIGEQT